MFSEITFSDLGVDPKILTALDEMGYKHPTTVQENTYQVLKSGKDLLAQSRKGTRKTLAFGIPVMEMVTPGGRTPPAIIITPTRE